MLRAAVLTQYRRVTDGRRTDGQTDGIAVASTELAKRRAVKTAFHTVALWPSHVLVHYIYILGALAL